MSKKILIVEGDFVIANNLHLILQRAGYSLSAVAASVYEAVEQLQFHCPDLVLLDIQMKGKSSAIDLARKLRADDIPFIYLSANATQKLPEEAKSLEPYGFLIKPVREQDLLIMLDLSWSRHRQIMEAKLWREELLQRTLMEIATESSAVETRLLKIARALQSYVPFDFFSVGPRSVGRLQFDDLGCLRIGFDEYQFVAEKELLTMTGLKKDELLATITCSNNNGDAMISNETDPNYPLQKLLSDRFRLKSCLTFPVLHSDGSSVYYFFYSRCADGYMKNHISLLKRIKVQLTSISEKLFANINAVPINNPEFNGVIGNHPLLLAALDLSTQVAGFNTSVLILGESGTGKEKIAQSIHELSARKNGPFIKVNCAAIPAMLMESELFGHEKGAYTGAFDKRKGKFEQASKGTIFLDEIGELPLDMQVKLLRVLQEKEIESVGSSLTKKVDVRIVAATNRDLEDEVDKGNFRMDLYYRLNVFPITLPPLRERKSDIEGLALFFANRFCEEFKKPFTGIGARMMEEMYAYDWPGNIRELENVMEQSVILNNGIAELELKRNLKVKLTTGKGRVELNTLDDVRCMQRETERNYIISILRKTGGRIRGASGAAQLLKIKPTTLEAKMARLAIKREDFIAVLANL